MANSMTLAQAEFIANHVTSVFANKPPDSFCPLSKLQGYSIRMIFQSFALVVAGRRQMFGATPDVQVHNAECKKFADQAAALLRVIPMVVMPDEHADKLSKLPFDSDERKTLLRELIRERNKPGSDYERLAVEAAKQESPNDFNIFCWSLSHQDPFFWQKVYTRIGLPYDEDSPIGEPEFVFSNGNLHKDSYFRGCWGHYKFRTAREQRQQRLFQWGLLIVASLFVAWFIWTIFVEPKH